MRKASKILLLIWDILLIPVIAMVAAHFLGFYDFLHTAISNLPRFLSVPLDALAMLSLFVSALSTYLIPQIISIVLVILNFAMPLYPPTKKDRIFTIVLSVFAIVGAVCAFLSIMMMSAGEAGMPIP